VIYFVTSLIMCDQQSSNIGMLHIIW